MFIFSQNSLICDLDIARIVQDVIEHIVHIVVMAEIVPSSPEQLSTKKAKMPEILSPSQVLAHSDDQVIYPNQMDTGDREISYSHQTANSDQKMSNFNQVDILDQESKYTWDTVNMVESGQVEKNEQEHKCSLKTANSVSIQTDWTLLAESSHTGKEFEDKGIQCIMSPDVFTTRNFLSVPVRETQN